MTYIFLSVIQTSSRDKAYGFFLEEKEYGTALFKRIMNATEDELVVYLTSKNEEERWLAQWRLRELQNKC